MATFVRSPIGGSAHNAKDKISKTQNLSIAKSSFPEFFLILEIRNFEIRFLIRERDRIELFGIDERTKTSLIGL